MASDRFTPSKYIAKKQPETQQVAVDISESISQIPYQDALITHTDRVSLLLSASDSQQTSAIKPFPQRSYPVMKKVKRELVSVLSERKSQDDSHLLGDMLEDSDEVIILSAVCCFMRSNLTRIQDYFEQTLPRYLPDAFKHHFRMTRETCELLSLEMMQTGQIPITNWIANQEPARAVADRFDLTSSSVDRVFRRVVLAAVSLCGQYIKWPTGKQMSEPFSLFYLKPGWLITPYRDNGHLTAHQKRFNRGDGKLLFLDHLDLELEVNIIIAACVLHNFCLLNDDFDDGYFLDGDNEDNDAEQRYPDARAEQKRTHLMNIVCGLPPLTSFSYLTIFDLLSLLTCLLSLWVSLQKPSTTFSFGYERFEVLAVFSSTVLVMFGGLFIVKESTERLLMPSEVITDNLLPAAAVGLFLHLLVTYGVSNKPFSLVSQTASSNWLQDAVNDFGHSICGFAPFLSQALVQKLNPISLVGIAGAGLVLITDAMITYNYNQGACTPFSKVATASAKSSVQSSPKRNRGIAWSCEATGTLVELWTEESILNSYVADSLCAIVAAFMMWATMLPLSVCSGQILLQTCTIDTMSQIDKCLREASTLDGVLEFRNEHFWTISFGR
ncbi:Zinc transporter 6, partial [Acropora cervicornis]